MAKLFNADDYVGYRWGKLEVISVGDYRGKGTYRKIIAKCDCGTIKEMGISTIYSKEVVSCGCNKRIKATRGLSNLEVATNQSITSYKAGARKRNLSWNLSVKESRELLTGPCTYCGSPGEVWRPYSGRELAIGRENMDIKITGIDRINSNIGYIFTNCTSCCKQCNWMKLNYTVEQFLKHCKRVVEHNK